MFELSIGAKPLVCLCSHPPGEILKQLGADRQYFCAFKPFGIIKAQNPESPIDPAPENKPAWTAEENRTTT